MFINEIDFRTLFDGILKILFSFYSGVLHGKSADFPAKNVNCTLISSHVIQLRDLITRLPEVCRMGKPSHDDINDPPYFYPFVIISLFDCGTVDGFKRAFPKKSLSINPFPYLTHYLIHHLETVPNSKKPQTTIDSWLFKDI